ncbi:hypothetical protein DXT77_25565 [Pseudomonas sp. 91RF]|jgi:hypothetical protein|uniref:glycosyltransferase family 39 protein n=1 Tax=Pseudomonas sp. 91RF TaxID=2292261 RepID=UPI000E663A1E|nr:glycosyltransferase family 39 protein [Pseudomonas sp. 91RF]RIJ07339.1 hypothetical protein DXT77_25565 [Pseudomonas sp. 91RF]
MIVYTLTCASKVGRTATLCSKNNDPGYQARDVMASEQKMFLPMVLKAWSLLILMLSGVAVIAGLARANALSLTFSAACLACVLLIGFIMARSNRWRLPAIAGPILLACIMLALGLWVFFFDSGQVSDFGVYYRCGTGDHSSLQAWLENCQSQYLTKNSTYWLRSFFYSSAIGQLIGGDYSTFKVVNALVHMATVVVWYYGVRASYGVRVASLSSVLLALYPEYWFTTTLVTTDNFAVLCVALFILMAPKLNDRLSTALVFSLFLGIVIFLGHQLRSIGSIFVLSLLFYLICGTTLGKRYSGWVAGAAALLVFVVCSFAFSKAYETNLPDLFSPVKIVSAIDFHTTQGFAINYLWAEHFWPATPQPLQLPMAIYKISTEFSGGFLQWPAYVFNKAVVVFSGTGYYGLSAFAYPPDNPDSLVTTTVSNIPFSAGFFPWLSLIVFMYLVSAVVGVFRSKVVSGPALVSLLVLGVFGLLVLGMGESQARYSAIIAPALALLAALAFFSPVTEEAAPERLVSFGKGYLIGLAVILGLFLIILLLTKVLPSSEQLNGQVKLVDATALQSTSCSSDGVSLAPDYKKVRVAFAGTSNCAVVKLDVPAGTATVSFYLSGSRFPFRFEGPGPNVFSYQLLAGESILSSGQTGETSVNYVQVELPKGSEHELVLKVKKLNAGASDYIDVSLIRAIAGSK